MASGTVAVLLQLALLTQSRGAMLGLLVGAVFYFVLSPARVRSVLFLVIPAALAAISFPALNTYYTEGVAAIGRWPAVAWLVGSWVVAAAAGLGFAWTDRRVKVAGWLRATLSTIVALAILAGAAAGFLALQQRVGDVSHWIGEVGASFVGETGGLEPGSGQSRFEQGGGGGRGDMWDKAWLGFLDAPVIGNGAGSFPRVDERYGGVTDRDRSQAHSLELDLLSETGVIGTALFFAWLGLAVVAALASRRGASLQRAGPETGMGVGVEVSLARDAKRYARASRVALVAGVAVWFGQASVDWLWQVSGVTLGCLLLLAFALDSNQSGEPA